MPEVSFPVTAIGSVPVIKAPEEIDITNAGELRSALLEATANRHPAVVVDMSRTQFCDSTGINVLIRAHQRVAAEGGQVHLVISTAHVRRVVRVIGIDRVVPTFSTLDEALAASYPAAIHPPAAD